MRFKLDESLSPSLKEPLLRAGHDIETVREESLIGAADSRLASICRKEGRCLITADEDFAQILDYPPENYPGLVVLWHPRPSLKGMAGLVKEVVEAVKKESPKGRLWIVEPGRIRIHEAAEDD